MSRARALAVAAALAPLAVGLSACGHGNPPPATEVVRFEVRSNLLGMSLQEIGVRPPALPGGAKRPLLVLLPGWNMYPDGFLGLLDGSVEKLGASAPDVVIVNGGQGSFYHDRSSGPWGRYVLDEAIPAAIRTLGADPSRIAIGGISMGGFGALDLSRLEPTHFCAVGGHSPALYASRATTPPGAFDNAGDFARNDVFALAKTDPKLWSMPMWIDVGTNDPFRLAATAFSKRLKAAGDNVTFHVWPGAHEPSYWSSHIDQYMSWYAQQLANC